jgi:hypothetical protein
MFRFRLVPLILALTLSNTACLFQKRPAPRVFVPPPPAPRPAIATSEPELPPAPEIGSHVEPPDLEIPANMPNEAAPPPSPAPRRIPPPVRATIPAPPAIPVEPAPAAPRLSQIFTAEQLREYNRTLEDSLDRVRKVLGTVASKNLNSEQTQVVQRIQTFQKQAEQAREQDLVTAVNLARRADLLAQDLIKRLP